MTGRARLLQDFDTIVENCSQNVNRLPSVCCFRTLLIQDYGFLQKINIWPPFVTVGIYCASLSAAMCAMIGASRILHALAVDQLFGEGVEARRVEQSRTE